MALAQRASARSVPAVERAIQMLKALGSSDADQRLSDLSRALGISKSTAYQLLQTLEAHGLVERDPESRRYRLGYGLIELAGPVLGRLDLRALARPSLRRLCAETGQTVFLGVRDGDRIVIVEKEEPSADLKITAPVGRRIPITAGSFGKLFLAYADPADLDRLLGQQPLRRFTARTITEPAAYRRVLEATRQLGFALDDEEYLEGVRGISAPILGAAGELAAALAVVGFSGSMPDERLAAMIEATVRAAATISQRLGALHGERNGQGSGQDALTPTLSRAKRENTESRSHREQTEATPA